MRIRSALSSSQKEAIKSPKAAKVLVESLNKEVCIQANEIEVQKETIRVTQDELEVWRSRFHNVDKNNSVLSSKLEFFVGIEVFKYLLSAIGTAYGVNLVSSRNNNGWFFILGSATIYVLVTIWQNLKKSNRNGPEIIEIKS